MKRETSPTVFFVGLVASLVLCVSLLNGCAKKDLETEFRPLQIQWLIAPGESEEDMPTKDNCVIRLTAALMGETVVQSSPIEEIAYTVSYGRKKESPSILYFTGACADSSRMASPECRWSATCDKDLDIVVKFHNGD